MDLSLIKPKPKILILGDIMLDQYISGPIRRISPEAPVPVVHYKDCSSRLGGAANVAANIKSLGLADVFLLGLVGDDQHADIIQDLLESQGIQSLLHRQPDISTTTKLRVLSSRQQLLRIDTEEVSQCITQLPLYSEFADLLSDSDLLLLSDYAKGSLANPQPLIQEASRLDVRTIIDPKGSDFSKYKGAYILTPNLAEFFQVVGVCPTETEIHQRAQELIQNLCLSGLLITRSEDGMTLLLKDEEALSCPADAQLVYDVTGAGDTVVAVFSSLLVNGYEVKASAAIANSAAGIAVAKVGTSLVSHSELAPYLTALTDDQHVSPLVSYSGLEQILRHARASGYRVVMTNGCFDVLHPGHLDFLSRAKALGDLLVVVINSDASVRKLKGPARPINSLLDRATMLSGLSCVDYVASFSEETPLDFYTRFTPDVLVKGGDYQVSTIIGGDIVLESGGEVKALDLLGHYSTTQLVQNILTAYS